MHIHFRLLFRRASEPSSSDRTAKQQIAYAQNSSIIQEIWNKIKVQFSSIRNKNQVQNACTEISWNYARLSFLGYNITWEEVPHDAATDRIRPIARFPNWRLCNTQLEKAVAIADFMSDDKYQE